MASTVGVPLTGFSRYGGFVAGETAGPGFNVAVVRRPQKTFSAVSGTAVFAVVPSSCTL